MDLANFTSEIDLVDVSLWLFTIFFFGLIFYLRREDRREGYPLESDETGKQEESGVVWMPPEKEFRLPHGRGTAKYAFGPRDKRQHALKRTAPWAGAPYEPTGDPMVDGVGPASYAERADYPDLTLEGTPRIVPFRVDADYTVSDRDRDPRGMEVRGTDGGKGGEVVDLWIDRSEGIIRYYEVSVDMPDGTKRNVLLPVGFALIKGGRRDPHVAVEALRSDHFAKVPGTRSPDSVTRLEEDRIMGFYGGGKLYAVAERAEPLV